MQLQDQPRAAESLDMEIDVLYNDDKSLKKLSFLNFLRKGETVDNEKVEWQDDQMPPESISITASGAGADWDTNNDITALPVATAQITKLKVGDVLMLPLPAGSGEQVIVSSIDVAGQTIGLHKRGWGGTTATAQGAAAVTAYIIGNAQVDGSDPIDASYYAPTERYNYVQIFEDKIGVGGKQLRSRTGKIAEVARQRSIKLPRLLSQVNYAILNGSREKDSNRATFQGLRNAATTTSNVNGALTVVKTYAALIAMENAGGNCSAIHANAMGISRLEQLFAAFVTSGVSEYNAKLTVNSIEILGRKIELHLDKHMVDTEMLLLDYDRISIHVQEANGNKGTFSSYVTTDNGKQYEEELAGYYTVKIKQPAASIVRAYGITG
jgi:hypothetical protein